MTNEGIVKITELLNITLFIGLGVIIGLLLAYVLIVKQQAEKEKEKIRLEKEKIQQKEKISQLEAMGLVGIQANCGGRVYSVLKKVGDPTHEGDTILVIESMKIEFPQIAPADGFIENINVQVGDVVNAGDILCSYH